MEHLYKECQTDEGSNVAAEKEEEKVQPEIAPKNNMQLKPCRYGNSCTRPDCKFWHPETEAAVPEPIKVDIGAKCASLGLSWIPNIMTLNLQENGKVTSTQNSDETENVVATKSYEL